VLVAGAQWEIVNFPLDSPVIAPFVEDSDSNDGYGHQEYSSAETRRHGKLLLA
jgi:hypothetical protein